MSDYQQIPGSIRSLLATKTPAWSDQAVELANQYAVLNDEVNQRLRRCAEYLRRGMTSAALHLADCQPNLLEAVSALQFPERSGWADLCVLHGMAAPPVLEVDCLPSLKIAYEREKSLQPLLSRHRLLGIAKSSTKSRLEVARLLNAEDPENSAWVDEVIGLESVRLTELFGEIRAAIRERNDDAVRLLWDEVAGQPWRLELPPDLRTALESTMGEIKAKQAIAEMTSLAEQLASEFEAHRLGEIPLLARKWKEMSSIPGVVLPPHLLEKVQPAIEWQATEERRKREMDDIKPFQQLFEMPTSGNIPKADFRGWLFLTAVVLVLFGASVAAHYYLQFFHQWPWVRLR